MVMKCIKLLNLLIFNVVEIILYKFREMWAYNIPIQSTTQCMTQAKQTIKFHINHLILQYLICLLLQIELTTISDYAFGVLPAIVGSFCVVYPKVRKSTNVIQPTKISVIQKMHKMSNSWISTVHEVKTITRRLTNPSKYAMPFATQTGFRSNYLRNSENWRQLKASPFLQHLQILLHIYCCNCLHY